MIDISKLMEQKCNTKILHIKRVVPVAYPSKGRSICPEVPLLWGWVGEGMLDVLKTL